MSSDSMRCPSGDDGQVLYISKFFWKGICPITPPETMACAVACLDKPADIIGRTSLIVTAIS